MLSNQIIIDCILKIREMTGESIQVYTPAEVLITESGTAHSEDLKRILRELEDTEDNVVDRRFFLRVEESGRLEYLLSAEDTPTGRIVGKMTALQIETLLRQDLDQFDRDDFFKNLLLDNLLLVDIFSRASRLGIEIRKKRIAFLVEMKKNDSTGAEEILRALFAEDVNCFITSVDEHHIVIIHEIGEDEGETEFQRKAEVVADMLQAEGIREVRVSYGRVADEIRRVANSYKEAKMALGVGKIFYPDAVVISYDALGIGRLIYQLPVPMCRLFIEEIFKGQSPARFDEETLQTINEYFANSLNVSETSRKLYIHRNTLVYRLDKIQRMTGLDLRNFDDAITFKMALMVVKYMDFMDQQDL